MMSDELVEKVARAICREQCAQINILVEDGCQAFKSGNIGPSPKCEESGCLAIAAAAVSVVLEEVAKIAAIQSVAPGYSTNEHMMAHRIAKSIRALGE